MSETTTITAQVPPELRDEINRIAESEHRSASGQIRLFLESCIVDYRAGRFSPPRLSPSLPRGRAQQRTGAR